MDSDTRTPPDAGDEPEQPTGPDAAGHGAHQHDRDDAGRDGITEFAEELKLLAEAVLERIEPVFRRAAADGQPEWSSCSWCPVCAAAALIRGEQHDVLAAVADHGTAIVTVLREALAGVPVAPVTPEHAAAQEGSAPGPEAGPRTSRGRKSEYVGIPVTIKP